MKERLARKETADKGWHISVSMWHVPVATHNQLLTTSYVYESEAGTQQQLGERISQ